jgi:xylan 1,4-beta-xylosidase
MTTRTRIRLAAITSLFIASLSLAFAADSPEAIEAKLKSRDQAIHLMNDWMRDPFITRGPDGLFYLSCTRLENIPGKKQGIEIWTSKDLVEWKNAGVPWTTENSSWLKPIIEEAKTRPDGKGYLLWAPEICFLNDKWVVVHTANVGKANLFHNQSKELKGPFVEPMGAEFGRRHDPSLFTDDDGTQWLIYGCTQIVPLKPDLSGLAGAPVNIAPSNRKMGHEGCQIIKVGNKYVLFGTAWSTDKLRHGTYNLYYCTADKITGPYGPRQFAGRFLGHGTVFQDGDGKWWCTAFFNANVAPLKPEQLATKDLSDNAYTINRQGLTIVPMDIRIKEGDVAVKALDPAYAKPGPEEVQRF